MKDRPVPARPLPRLFATYAVISLVPVIGLGAILAASYQTEARQRGLAEGTSEALLVARTAVEPQLDGRPLTPGLSAEESADLRRIVTRAVGEHDILRLRLRDLQGRIVFSDDGTGLGQAADDEALQAARGTVVSRVTRLNADDHATDDHATDDDDEARPAAAAGAGSGPQAVEVYVPLSAGTPTHRVGVLEIYLPYAPIAADVSAGLHGLYRMLAVGLGLLYLVLFVITVSVSRGLRRQVRITSHVAEHDALTDLPNRGLFRRHAAAAVAGSTPRRPCALAIVDLDRFKEVNDALGHRNGDELLAELARRLVAVTRPGDLVARLGGDEFGLVLCDAPDPEEALHRLRGVIEDEVSVSGLPLSVESSIGYVVTPEDGTDVDELLQRADVAMYAAKANHAGVVRYDPSHDHYDAAKLALLAELRRAIEADELVLHYQPKVVTDDGTVEAVEALLRWQHPVHGFLGPDRFIPVAEQTELIDRLTDWVCARALADLHHLGPDAAALRVAVNVSARNLCGTGGPAFAARVVDHLEALEMAPWRLIVEITETALVTDPPRAAAVLSELDAAGVEVSLDDFGCGNTSLGYLSTLPVHELKIDRSYVADMVEDRSHAAIVRSVIDLGHNLSLRVVAEGVETAETLEALRQAGCDLVQGYLLARPMPVADLVDWLSTAATGTPVPAP